MKINTTLSKNEYGLVRILRALANENRFIVFKNLQKGRCYATELNGPLKISRPALGKHVRILINEGLVEQKHVIEGGTAKTVYELTDFGANFAERINKLTMDIEAITSQITRRFHEELLDINTQINSTKAILKGLEKRIKNKELSPQVHTKLKNDYRKTLDTLMKKQRELKERLSEK